MTFLLLTAVLVVSLAAHLVQTLTTGCGCSLETRLLAILCGEYSNAGDIGRLRQGQAHDEVTFVFQEVDVPALQHNRVIYFEEKLNSVVLRQEVLVLDRTVYGAVKLSVHNFNLPAESGNFSVSLLHDLPLSAFTSRPDCVTVYRPVEYNLFVGIYPDCSGRLQLQTIPHPFVLSCNAISVVGRVKFSLESASNIPYSVWKINSLPLKSYGNCGESILEELCTC
ncbi:uncharacterized protein LOC131942913 [Physella acuta]|uniref:uncharacterized protein LOC131942913 n=1 Tax=Physella acuta TaxID=109671 RepID=UPI0027DDA9A6|nr:uncharacterized protein LOC131942913 [Physella acuta]